MQNLQNISLHPLAGTTKYTSLYNFKSLVITSAENVSNKLVTLEIGARGYIPKQSNTKLMSVIKKSKTIPSLN